MIKWCREKVSMSSSKPRAASTAACACASSAAAWKASAGSTTFACAACTSPARIASACSSASRSRRARRDSPTPVSRSSFRFAAEKPKGDVYAGPRFLLNCSWKACMRTGAWRAGAGARTSAGVRSTCSGSRPRLIMLRRPRDTSSGRMFGGGACGLVSCSWSRMRTGLVCLALASVPGMGRASRKLRALGGRGGGTPKTWASFERPKDVVGSSMARCTILAFC
mmetsp:Transcript_20088/g.59354  ORF Transcript_20088/g.59354 Transcript_20088/m.59354 type:complete len:224 (-) Transcript_20088:447-1118(-)